MKPLDELQQTLQELDDSGTRRWLRTVRGASGRFISLDGRRVLDFSSNNYLGLADHPYLKSASIAAVEAAGTSSSASRLISGNRDTHVQLEQALATFHGRAATRLFNSGYQANLGVLPTLAHAGDVVFSDALNHASIIDGCRLSRAEVRVFPHRDIDTLRDMLASRPGRRRFVVTDSLFSMDGDFAPLGDLATLCHEYDALLVVDEAHAVGVLGPRGEGLGAELGVVPDIHVGTFGKAFGSYGAYVAGEAVLAEILLNQARSFIFTTALPPGVVAASLAALELVTSDEGNTRRTNLERLIKRMRGGLASRQLLSPGSGRSAIFPIRIGDDKRTMVCCERLLERDIFVQGIRPPTVPARTARLRLTLMATHGEEDIERVGEALDELLDEGLIPRVKQEARP